MHTLATEGVTGDCWHALDALQEGVQGKVRVGSTFSDLFGIVSGILEGSVSSPVKYTLYAEHLARALRQRRLGLELTLDGLGIIWFGLLGFVDDKLMCASSMPEAQVLQATVAYVAKLLTDHPTWG